MTEQIRQLGKNVLSDLLNGRAYVQEQNTFNLVLFADAANYNKSGNRSWAVFSTLVELPPSQVYALVMKT